MARGGALGAAVSAGVLAGCGGSSGPDVAASARIRASQARTVARQAGLDQSVQDFLARAAAASQVTSTVVYDQGSGQSTVVMARPPDRRIDIRGATDTVSVDRVVVKGTATYVCHLAEPKWTCVGGLVAAPSGPFTPDAITQTISSLVQLSQRYQFAVSHRTMVNVVADCLSADRKPTQPADSTVGDHAAICIAPNGVILRVEGAGEPLQATSFRGSVPSGAFDLPARATAAPISTSTSVSPPPAAPPTT